MDENYLNELSSAPVNSEVDVSEPLPSDTEETLGNSEEMETPVSSSETDSETETEGVQEGQENGNDGNNSNVEETASTPSRAEMRRRAVDRAARQNEREKRTERQIKIAEFQRQANLPPQRKNIYTGVLASVRPASNDLPVMGEVAIENGEYMVLVPFEEFFTNNPLRRSSEEIPQREYNNRAERLLRNSIGAVIHCVINVAVDNGELTIITGSRKAAMQLQQRYYFFAARNPIEQGQIVDATVFAVERAGHTMWVELGGIECQLFPSQITYRPIRRNADLYEMGYHPGKPIKVYVSQLELGENFNVKNIEVSAAIAESAEWESRMANLSVGQSVMGEVVWMRTTQNVNSPITGVAWLEHMKVPVRITSLSRYSSNVGPGSKVMLRITRDNPDDREHIRFYARVLSILPISNF